MEKVCTKCKELKKITEYNKAGKGYRPSCRSCCSKAEKERRLLNGGTIRLDRSIETETTKICTKCLILKDKSQFKNPSWCVSCINTYNREVANKNGIIPKFIPIITETQKQCCKCKELKNIEDYSNSPRGRLGKSSYCKTCMTYLQVNKYSTKEERAEKTQNYRENNREWWRFLHRINQFNRKNKVKRVTDKTVTKDFIIKLYDTTTCYFCKKEIEEKERTCEHLQPISKGGIHGISNIVMACISCNCSKGNKTEEEYYKYLKEKEND